MCQEKPEMEVFVSNFLFRKTTQLLGELASMCKSQWYCLVLVDPGLRVRRPAPRVGKMEPVRGVGMKSAAEGKGPRQNC